MKETRIRILSTRSLSDPLVTEAKMAGIAIDTFSFIETKPIQSIEVRQEIEQALLRTVPVVFTSMNAVEAVAVWLDDQQPAWTIYCMGNTTRQLVKKYFGEESIAESANSAAELAKLIAKDDPADEVIFFCGDQRRDELPEILSGNQINVKEIEVYQTIAVLHKIEKAYDGILFFSPSAVESFFRNNQISKQTKLFAIGNTTATEIKKYTNNQIIVSNEPGKENLVRQMMEYFS
jgi:uroporphyrinogen-III synthase